MRKAYFIFYSTRTYGDPGTFHICLHSLCHHSKNYYLDAGRTTTYVVQCHLKMMLGNNTIRFEILEIISM